MRGRILLLAGVLALVTVTEAYPAKLRDNLKGLRGVWVWVEYLDPELEERGVTQFQIQTLVELKLRQAGIRVLTEEERKKTPGDPFLSVRICGGKTSDRLNYVLLIELRIVEKVIPERDKNKRVWALTWNSWRLGSAGTQHLRSIYDNLGDLVDEFMNDYLAANPK